MTKGLFITTEEIAFQYAYVNGHIAPKKGFPKNSRQIHQDSQRIARNVKKLNQSAHCFKRVR